MRSCVVTAAGGLVALGLIAFGPARASAQQVIVGSPGIIVTPAFPPPVIVAPAFPPVVVTPAFPPPVIVTPAPIVVAPRFYRPFRARPRRGFVRVW
jgi:hypothetical protein